MSRWSAEDLQALTLKRLEQQVAAKPSKYRNQRVVINGEKFDSKREAAYYQELLLREKAGEVRNIRRQMTFHLCCPEVDAMMRQSEPPKIVYVASYVADFTFEEREGRAGSEPSDIWRSVVVDVKGAKTPMYLLKKKWLELQQGIVIREVR